MATLYTEQSKNVRRTWFLMGLFLVVVVALGWFISYYYNDSWILAIAILFAVLMNIASYWYSDKIALSISGAKPADREDNLELFRVVENLSITAGLPMPKIYIIDDPAPNAFATGRDKDHAAVAVTSGLLGMMDKNELEGVIAHELSHIGNRDILLSTVVVVLVGFIAILANIFTRSLWFGGGRKQNDGEGNGQSGAILAIVGIIFVILSPIVAQLIQLAISRKRELLADTDGALLTRYPEGLASALLKIQAHGEPMKKANNATAHLFIANPFGPHAFKGMAKLFMTHPPVEDRVKALRGIE
ncbi:M48 family metallopeptidase [Patescibacteria group bacterium]|nr:M48 family metallopeptidase [Patescibacteria group bacterium]MDE1946665.1 M48 family metallopeptidase [Patescibacteria group bacterium]MDE2010618.1 M48 family metallopeptidase [Patescibacteria group bacterium]MDE2232935.1 M48 family metallopeptidase [Patescibacteria group bacterium]